MSPDVVGVPNGCSFGSSIMNVGVLRMLAIGFVPDVTVGDVPGYSVPWSVNDGGENRAETVRLTAGGFV